MSEHLPWPPNYTIRKSSRARRLSFKICEFKGLEVVLPSKMSERHIPALLESHKEWICHHLAKVARVQHTALHEAFPEALHLEAIGESWQLQLCDMQSHYLRLYPDKQRQRLMLQGPIEQKDEFRALIIKWLQRKAKRHFSRMMDELCEQHGFSYNRLSIRSQKTRWGSCSSQKNINLNYKLLLMPRRWAEHIMLHELCHTVHLNHSEAFWSLLNQVDSNMAEHHRATKTFKTPVTYWLDR